MPLRLIIALPVRRAAIDQDSEIDRGQFLDEKGSESGRFAEYFTRPQLCLFLGSRSVPCSLGLGLFNQFAADSLVPVERSHA